nr:hypothetical protein CFP56_53639 [Quercus suber]
MCATIGELILTYLSIYQLGRLTIRCFITSRAKSARAQSRFRGSDGAVVSQCPDRALSDPCVDRVEKHRTGLCLVRASSITVQYPIRALPYTYSFGTLVMYEALNGRRRKRGSAGPITAHKGARAVGAGCHHMKEVVRALRRSSRSAGGGDMTAFSSAIQSYRQVDWSELQNPTVPAAWRMQYCMRLERLGRVGTSAGCITRWYLMA